MAAAAVTRWAVAGRTRSSSPASASSSWGAAAGRRQGAATGWAWGCCWTAGAGTSPARGKSQQLDVSTVRTLFLPGDAIGVSLESWRSIS